MASRIVGAVEHESYTEKNAPTGDESNKATSRPPASGDPRSQAAQQGWGSWLSQKASVAAKMVNHAHRARLFFLSIIFMKQIMRDR